MEPLHGTVPVHRTGAARHAPLSADQRLQVTVVLHPPDREPRVSEAEAVAVVERFAARHGLRVVERSAVRQDVILEGPAPAVGTAFGVELHHYHHARGRYHGHEGPVHLPADLIPVVDGVLGLDAVPRHRPAGGAAPATAPRFTALDLAARYRFPGSDASGLSFGLLEFGGGYYPEDIQAYATGLGIGLPPITDVPVAGNAGHHGSNAPLARNKMVAIAQAWRTAATFGEILQAAGDMNTLLAFMESMEVTMDLELAVALGGGARVQVYFAPDSGADGWRRALYSVIGAAPGTGAGSGATVPPAVLSVSWGACESEFTTAELRLIDRALQAVRQAGVLVVCSTGDHGSTNLIANATCANVNFPASSPAVVACGGTTIAADGRSETVWNGAMFGTPVAGGGGMSGYFPQPGYQQGLRPPDHEGTWLRPQCPPGFAGRWLPDLAANAAFESAVGITVGGETLAGGGTSAATPIWAALLVQLEAALGRRLPGFPEWLYREGGAGCRDVVAGNNDVAHGAYRFYQAGPGWDACTGFGCPDGRQLLARLTSDPPANGS